MVGRGQYIRGVMWLEIVYGIQNQSLSPLQAVLKAYDDMLHAEKREFVVG
jgi:hypothetical protein